MTVDVIDRARRTTRRRLGNALAVLAAASLATAAVVLAVTGAGPAQPPSAPAPAEPQLVDRDSGAAGQSSTLPADLRWTEVSGALLPVSASAGPHDSSAGLARGFAHTPAGAVLAGFHLLVRVTPQAGAAVFEPTLRSQVVGPDAAAMRDQVAHDYDDLRGRAQVPYGQPGGRLYATLRGYRVDSYNPDLAGVRVLTASATTDGGEVLTDVLIELRWTGGDWALVAPPDGRWDSVITVVPAEQTGGYQLIHPGR